jgi:hypothetical protein
LWRIGSFGFQRVPFGAQKISERYTIEDWNTKRIVPGLLEPGTGKLTLATLIPELGIAQKEKDSSCPTAPSTREMQGCNSPEGSWRWTSLDFMWDLEV